MVSEANYEERERAMRWCFDGVKYGDHIRDY